MMGDDDKLKVYVCVQEYQHEGESFHWGRVFSTLEKANEFVKSQKTDKPEWWNVYEKEVE